LPPQYNHSMSKTDIPYLVEPTLTPLNAEEKGYRFVEDVVDPYTAVQELIELAEKAGYTFGRSAGKKGKVGLYKREG
jgi:hypothetical protein